MTTLGIIVIAITIMAILFELFNFIFDHDKIKCIRWFLKNKNNITNWNVEKKNYHGSFELSGSYKKYDSHINITFGSEYDILSDKIRIKTFTFYTPDGDYNKLFSITGIISFFVKLYIKRWAFQKINIIGMGKDLNLL